MNKAVTDGLVFTPPKFAEGLTVWSRGDGTPGSPTYDGAADAAVVSADADFGSCLEMQKTETTQSLRYMGQTVVVPGCYLQVSAMVKAIAGNFPTIKVAAYAADGAGLPLSGVVTVGPTVTLDTYGEVTTVRAIVGTGTTTVCPM